MPPKHDSIVKDHNVGMMCEKDEECILNMIER
jgi:hypothetical protein